MCDAYDMSYHKQETKHKEVCAVWGKTGQTSFRNRPDQFYPVNPQITEKLKEQLVHQTNMHHKLTLSHLEIFRVHYTHCSTQYKSSQVQHIDKVQQIIITDPNLSTSL
jgi:hypothetical protein